MKETLLTAIRQIPLHDTYINTRYQATKAVAIKKYYSDTELGDPDFGKKSTAHVPSGRSLFKRIIIKTGKKIISPIYRITKRVGRALLHRLDPVILTNLRSVGKLVDDIHQLKQRILILETENKHLNKIIVGLDNKELLAEITQRISELENRDKK